MQGFSNNISTQCMSSVPKALISNHAGVFKTILVLNVCQCSKRHSLVPCKGFKQYYYSMYVQCCKSTHQYHARVSNNISTQCMSVFQRHSFSNMQGFSKQYQYSMYVSIPNVTHQQPCKAFQTILVLNVCQCSKAHSSVTCKGFSNNISTQCMSEFQRHSLVTCQGFNQYQYSMYVSVPKALISIMQGFQTKLVLNVCQCSKGTHQYHARGFKQYQ